MAVEPDRQDEDTHLSTEAQFTGAAGAGEPQAWEEVDTGRYMPRRIRGSFKGRALG